MSTTLNVLTILCGAGSAYFWWRSSAMKIDWQGMGAYGGVAQGVLDQLQVQTRLNKWAAGLAAACAALQSAQGLLAVTGTP